MIKTLRKRHLQIWTIIAVLLPMGIIFSWIVIPNPVPLKASPDSTVELLPVVQVRKETNQYCINIRSNKEKTNWQLEWKNKLALAAPSAVIYTVSPRREVGGGPFKVASAELIGRIEARGDYVFPFKRDANENKEVNLVIYDFIHEKIIDTIIFLIPFPPGR